MANDEEAPSPQRDRRGSGIAVGGPAASALADGLVRAGRADYAQGFRSLTEEIRLPDVPVEGRIPGVAGGHPAPQRSGSLRDRRAEAEPLVRRARDAPRLRLLERPGLLREPVPSLERLQGLASRRRHGVLRVRDRPRARSVPGHVQPRLDAARCSARSRTRTSRSSSSRSGSRLTPRSPCPSASTPKACGRSASRARFRTAGSVRPIPTRTHVRASASATRSS